MWKEKLRKLIGRGHLRRLPAEEWSGLTGEECKKLYEKALQNPPLSCMAAALEQKNLLRSDLAQGLLRGLRSEDIGGLTAAEAEILLMIASENRWTAQEPYHEIVKKEFSDVEAASPEQIRKIRELIREKHLHPLSGNTLLKISQLSAKRLIWKGEMNRRKN